MAKNQINACCNRSGIENLGLALQSRHGIPCHYGNIACPTARHLGADPTCSPSLYPDIRSACGDLGLHSPYLTRATQPNLTEFLAPPVERSATARTAMSSSRRALSRRSTGTSWLYPPPGAC